MLRTVSRIVPGLFLIVLIGLGIVIARSGQIEGGLMASTGAQPGAAEAQFGLPTYFGSLEVARSRAIAPGVNGEVLELLVEVGDLVGRGPATAANRYHTVGLECTAGGTCAGVGPRRLFGDQ